MLVVVMMTGGCGCCCYSCGVQRDDLGGSCWRCGCGCGYNLLLWLWLCRYLLMVELE